MGQRMTPVIGAAIGVAFGACTQCLLGQPDVTASSPVPNPNVVVLKSEKTITLDSPSLTLSELAAALSKQTGRVFVLDKPYSGDKTPYALLLAATPLGRVLDATGYVSGGRWDRKGNVYTLRTPTEHETALDAVRYGAALQKLHGYLAQISADDPSLPGSVQRTLARFRSSMAEVELGTGWLPPMPDDSMLDWKVGADRRSLNISWLSVAREGDTDTGKWKGYSWGWADAKR